LVVLALPLLAAASTQTDPIKRLDEDMVGAAITNVCNPSFDWKKRMKSADRLGREAYEVILKRMRAANPNDPDNETKADRAFKLRSQEMYRKGEQLVSEKGCADLDVQDRLREFESR